ncbi:hypothetical protein [Proteiniclasticum ruminis]|uniref:Uncharacterized protein n=1 Tax=Proteiniclasticum ruminis TaxID=398199 RepID=A0A1I5DD56_9CLOT|nr:hypothetical protein [Proteiniclasticum ruminis]SFN97194.1 hypothetical protein SAMN04488695_1095 [Proteiniclasticum ruminis]
MKLISESVAGIFSSNKELYYAASDDYGNREYRRYRGEIEEITEEEYFKAFNGDLYEPMVDRFGDRSTSRCWDQDGSLYVCYYQESVIYKFDRSGSLMRKYEEMGQVDTIYDIAVYGNSIWCAYPTSHTVKRFSLDDGSLEVSISDGEIGMDRGSLFCYPESLTLLGNMLYVSDRGNERVCRINLDTLEVETYLELDGPVFQYECVGDEEFVQISNELYLV